MPAKSKAQQKFMGMVHAYQKGDLENPSDAVKKVADSMKSSDVEDYASTKHKNKPEKVKKEIIKKLRELIRIELEGTCGYGIGGKLGDEPAGPHLLKKKKKNESVDESGILYRAGVKKYGKEGMKKIQQAAGKRKSHAEIGKIKDKYEKDKKESVSVNEINYSKTSTKKLVKIYKQMADERLSGSSALTFRLIAKELIKRKAKLESINEQKKRDANNLNMEFEKSYQRFTVAVNGLVKSMDNISGEKTDGKIIVKAFKKYLVPFHRLVNSWNKGYQKNPHINETQKRDYKAEYKKFQSSTKAKKYRAELNQYNRKKGTYGNGDGKDASHKGGKIAGFEKESTNRGRAEKSRLKKEDDMPDFEPMIDKILDEVIEEYQMNEDLTPLRKIYSDLDKKFPKYNHKKISDFNKAYKFLKRKLKPGSQLPDFVASFYNDYKGGEDITKNHKRFFKYTKKMLKKGESVNEANIIQKIDKLAKSNKYGTVDGTRMNGKTAKEIMAIFMHPKMNSYRRQMTGMKAHELVDLTISLLKPLKIKVESVDTVFKETLRKFIRQELVKEDWWSEMSPPAQDQYVKDHPDSEKAKSVKKSKEKGEKEKRELAKKIKSGEYELDSATGKAVKKKKGKEDPKKRNKHVAAIRKGYFPGTPEYEKFMKESVNEAVEPKGNMAKIFKIVKDKQHAKIGGMLVDTFSASALVKIFNAVKDSNKEKLNKMNIKKLAYVLNKAYKDKVVV